MLKLLLKTRIRYYRNYLKYHLDKVTIIELGLILLFFLFLLARSPGDIGYNLNWFLRSEFPQEWAKIFSIWLPIFYLISEIFAWFTLRPSAEWFILGTLPFPKKSTINYYLLRQSSKLFSFVLLGAIVFLGGTDSFYLRLMRLVIGFGFLISLQLISFLQAQNIRNPHNHNWQGKARWFLIEVLVIGLLLVSAKYIRLSIAMPLSFMHFGILPSWIIIFLFYFYIQRNFIPYVSDVRTTQRKASGKISLYPGLSQILKGPKTAFLFRDIFFLWRQKRSTFSLFIFGLVLLILISLIMEEAFGVYITLLSLQFLLSLLLMKTILLLFQNDVDGYELTRTLSIKASSFWLARWLFIFGFLSLQMVIPIIIIPFVFKVSLGYFGFALAGLFGFPSIMATLYCNSGFGMFPHVHLTGYMISVSILLIILFWFFMPFGSLIILGVILFWIRRSQKRFQYLELL
jgi:hypothetical protein